LYQVMYSTTAPQAAVLVGQAAEALRCLYAAQTYLQSLTNYEPPSCRVPRMLLRLLDPLADGGLGQVEVPRGPGRPTGPHAGTARRSRP
jgi:hypothetical protein